MEVEADGPPEQELAAVLGTGAAVEEDPVELHEARIDDERLLLLERLLGGGEPERVGDREADCLEAVTSSRHAGEPVRAPVATPAVWPQFDLLLPEAPDPLMGDDAR